MRKQKKQSNPIEDKVFGKFLLFQLAEKKQRVKLQKLTIGIF